MTLGPRVPARRGAIGLRTLLLLLFVAAALYGSALPIDFSFRVGSAAATLGEGTAAVTALLDELTRRSETADAAKRLAQRALAARAAAPGLGDSIRTLAARARTPMPATLPRVSPALRTEVGRAGRWLSAVSDTLVAASRLIDQRRWPDAARRVAAADSLTVVVEDEQRAVSRLAGEDLLAREAGLEATTTESRRDTVLWLVIGVLLVWLGLITIRRRIWQPLAALEAALTRVAEGDLNTQLPASQSDEAGRLAAHFNEMTRVLRTRAEEQGRFAAAGELLAGVAHEVSNPLMAIATHAENALADPGITPERRDEMQQVQRQAERATKLLRGLLRFVRATERHVVAVNLNDVVRGALDLVSYRFGVDEITVGGRLDASLPPVEADAIRLEQVVVNLLSNAIDALRTVKPPRQLTVDSWVENGSVSVAVSDNGLGVAPEVAARLFNPFATTKGRRGTGLGLYISRQIAREAGGDVVLAPAQRGGGARFVLNLPAAARAPAVVAARGGPGPALGAPASGPRVTLAGIRVLVVDDEPAIRRPMVKFLARRGAQVYEAGDGVEALEWLDGQTVDVILADLRMPRMSGTELFAALEASRPELAARLLFLSGDVSQLAEPGNTPVPRERVLVKPVELAVLEQRVAEFVAAAAAR